MNASSRATSIVGLCLSVTLMFNSPALAAARPTTQPVITVDVTRVLHDANGLILGNNVQWTDNADALWDSSKGAFNPALLKPLRLLKNPVLRFPGGTHSDFYHWKEAIGPVGGRKPGYHAFLKNTQPSNFGTDEFLLLCKKLNAQPLMTVNVVTGTPEEAAEWVTYCNKAGLGLYWEIGNEPYLAPDPGPLDPGYPEIYAQKFIAFAAAMKAANPNIWVGLPLRSNLMGRYPGGPYKDFNQRVLAICGSKADFISLHGAYFPSIFEIKDYKFPDSFLALMAAPGEVREDIEKVRRQVRAAVPSREMPIAITEYNAFFAMPQLSPAIHTASLGGALYTAALLMDFFKDRTILMANFWSLSGNGFFGAVRQDGRRRPQYHALKLFSDTVGKKVIFSEIRQGPVFNSPASGFMPAKQNVPVLDVLSTVTDVDSAGKKHVTILVINKSLDQDIYAAVEVANFKITGTPYFRTLNAPVMSSENEKAESTSVVTTSLRPDELGNFKFPKSSVTAIRLKGTV